MSRSLAGTVIRNLNGWQRYRLGPLLGKGGFGEVYSATGLRNPRDEYGPICIKITDEIEAWHRESYYGELFRRNDRVVQIYESFPIVSPRRVRYALVLELATGRDLRTYLRKDPSPWPEELVRSEVAGLLSALDHLHSIRGVHRDLTPMNVFVFGKRRLKLGDFGIARVSKGAVPASTLNQAFAPISVLQEGAKWRSEDDIWQMGQLVAMLVRGKAELLEPHALRKLRCSEKLKQIIRRTVGSRAARYRDAFELKEALQPTGRTRRAVGSAVSSLRGKTVVITGRLWTTRESAIDLVERAGGRVALEVSRSTHVLVVGSASPSYVAGSKGSKIVEAEGINAKGGRISIIGEKRFRELVRKRA